MFQTFFQQGATHILSADALDHILFLLALVAIYRYHEWKQLLLVVTMFTIAHSMTLVFSALNILSIPSNWVEIAIAATILLACLENILLSKAKQLRIFTSLCFGLVHGMGFSGHLKELFTGMQINWFTTLLPFNLGIEIGQIVVLAICLTLMSIYYKITSNLKNSDKVLCYMISVPVGIYAAWLIVERI
ncbi:MAG: HupE/UreJ family protein [Bacteroidetes bacterium]|nr:HupE/UreJ family protein [Bacteroidota bacterium]